MCGIAGKLFCNPVARATTGEIEAMLRPIVHRGPDSQGLIVDGPVGMGHCRLAIIDLSTGAQPMANEDETVWIVFNGEIYNYLKLHEELASKGHYFRTQSDTEVIIHLYEEYGTDCVNHLRGMFAFAVWDAKQHRLFLARDRVGIKPLYYCQTRTALYFASELKSLLVEPDVSRDIDLSAIRQFLSFYYLPGAHTLFRSVRKLLPGHCLIAEQGEQPVIHQYWDLRFTQTRWNRSFEQAAEELQDLLASTVRDHMMADVPVGVLLSGGVDSSAVLGLAIKCTDKPIKTFTVGFDGSEVVDERPYARLAAERFGTEHYDLTITADDFWGFLPSYVWHMEEPVCEPPALALYHVSKLARNHVKVLLSGEGGDEAFAGYQNYQHMLRLEQIRVALGRFAAHTGSGAAVLGNSLGIERMHRYGTALMKPFAAHYLSRTSGPTTFFNKQGHDFFSAEFLAATVKHSPARLIEELLRTGDPVTSLDRMIYTDTKTWLPDDLLVKADKMTMANSIELRVPFLDHEVLEFAASLPSGYKVRGSDTKRVLKAAFAKILPQEILKRKKAGFPIPYHMWLRGPLAKNVREVLLSSSACGRGYFNPDAVVRLLDNYGHTGAAAKEVFCLLVLELWHRQFVDRDPQDGQNSCLILDSSTHAPMPVASLPI